jgi:acyl-CoA dehydrogenase
VTEPGAGSDVQAMQTTAVKQGDSYVLNGNKMWITNAGVADWYFVVALTDPAKKAKGGMTGFIVERGWEGVSVGKKEPNMGQRASDTRTVNFDNVVVPEANVVGQVGDGWSLAMAAFDYTRAAVAAASVGVARAAMEYAQEYALVRKTMGVPIAQHQAIQFMLADMTMQIDAGRFLCWNAAWRKDQGLRNTKESSMAKAFCADMCQKVTSDAVQIFGGNGYSLATNTLVLGAPNPYIYPENLPRVNARGGPGGAPGCWQPITRDFWPAPYLVADTGASLAPYNHFELGQPFLSEYVWGRQIGQNTINP